MPNWRAVLAANDVVEVKLPKVEVNNDGNDKNDKNSNSSSSKASSSRTSSLELWYTAQVVRMEADKGLVHVRALVGGTNTRNYTVDVDADNLCKIGTHQDEASARKAVRELPPDKGDSAGVAAAATSPAPPNTEAATGSSSSSSSSSTLQPAAEKTPNVPDECAVCLEPLLANTVPLTCGHLLHEACLGQVRSAASKNATDGKGDGKVCCPLCNAEQETSPALFGSGALTESASPDLSKMGANAPGGGFSFGGAPAPAARAGGSGFSFGAPAPAARAAGSGFSFGAPAPARAAGSGFSFGAPAGSVATSFSPNV